MIRSLIKIQTLSPIRSGQLAIMIMFVFTGISHFFFTVQMVQMLPEWVPGRESLVYFTGVLEIVGGLAILRQRMVPFAGVSLIFFLLGVLPSNIYAAFNYTGMGGHVNGPSYLLFRIPLQMFFIVWIWFFTIRNRIAE